MAARGRQQATRRAGTRRPGTGHPLHVCPECASELVQPVDWHEAHAGYWSVTLRCPECEWRRTATHSQRRVDEYDEALDEGHERLLASLRELTAANMAAEVERFAAALEADAILPMDF